MEEKILFTEQQKFSQWWIWLLLIVLNVFFIFGINKQLIHHEPFGDHPTGDIGLLAGFGLILFVTLLFYTFKLQTIIKEDGIYVRFFPVQIAYRKYSWDKLTKTYVRKYSPIAEYGGWGFRGGISKSGCAFNVSGNQGLQLAFSDRQNLLIGTNKPDEIKEVLVKIGKYKIE
ncbi:hypothetical protein FNO01nite_17970 [Flavobacterium noncentrifugens]|uniref:Uncharacterized protein n=1 Tax=Flavobacterium noncentrifugens TaxID=1128970 RepID=A0A1G8Y8E7_9FLAO|nr:DUF6141 family protein [Flavobacterium noncentrifugens]GEP51125.1 hypothetical protein FNO01nite_17970 [Flavobacterium noncentrifugens]SDJ99011.1 hypothetical protein SAMN04487935_2228 [Flavobacterium noncentrifugens]